MSKRVSPAAQYRQTEKRLSEIRKKPPVIRPAGDQEKHPIYIGMGNRADRKWATVGKLGAAAVLAGVAAVAAIQIREATRSTATACATFDTGVEQTDSRDPTLNAPSSIVLPGASGGGVQDVFRYELNTDTVVKSVQSVCALEVTVKLVVDTAKFEQTAQHANGLAAEDFTLEALYNYLNDPDLSPEGRTSAFTACSNDLSILRGTVASRANQFENNFFPAEFLRNPTEAVNEDGNYRRIDFTNGNDGYLICRAPAS